MHHEFLARIAQDERDRGVAQAHIARLATCHRACCNPSRLDRIATRLGLNPCTQGA